MGRVHRVAVLADLEVQLGSLCAAAAQLGNYLTCFYILPFLHQNFTIMSISAQIMLIMIHDNQIAITQQPVASINNISTGSCPNSISGLPGNINTFVYFSG